MAGFLTTLPTALNIFIRTSIVYIFVLIGIRLSGKREVGQMNPFDLVLLILLSNAVQNAMVGEDSSLAGGIVAAIALLLLNATVGRLAVKHRFFGQLLRGQARLLVNQGKVIQRNLDREGILYEDLMQALREHGIGRLEDVYLAVLEVDGSISVLKQDDVIAGAEKSHRRIPFRRRQ